MTLRPAAAADEPFLEEMVRLAAGWRDGSSAPMTPALEAYVRGFGRRAGDLGVVAGDRGAAWCRLLDGGYGFVADDVPELAIAVVPHARGRGLGSELLAEMIASAEAHGHPALSLSVGADNRARRLYERHGFVKAAEKGEAWVMLRRARG